MQKLTLSLKQMSFAAVCMLFAATLVAPSALAAVGWHAVGGAGFSAGAVYSPAITLDSSGTPYVVYIDKANDNKATVMKFDGSNWQVIGGAGFSAGAANEASIVLDSSGTPYVSFRDGANGEKITVMKFDGTSWVTVGSAGFTTGAAYNISLAIDSTGAPYVGYMDIGNAQKGSVMKFDGSNWVTVGAAGFTSDIAIRPSFALDFSDVPYFAYTDVANDNKATVMKFDGSNWVTVGAAGFSAGATNNPFLALDSSGTPYLSYQDLAANNKGITVMKFDGTSWVTVGAAGFSTGSPYGAEPAIDASGTPYVAYVENANGNKATVMKFDGTNWVTVGAARFTADSAFGTSITVTSSGTPYVVYVDKANDNKATVMSYGEFDDSISDDGSTITPPVLPNNGDGNHDGTPDDEQNNVKTTLSSVSNKYVTVEVDESCALSDVSIAKASSLTTKDSNYDYGSGFVNFTASSCSGDSTNVKIYYHGVSPDGLLARKYNPNTNKYSTISSAKLTKLSSPLSGTLVSYTVTDNGALDTNPADGVIDDPVGLASVATGAPNTGLKQKDMLIFAGAILAGAGLLLSQTKLIRFKRMAHGTKTQP